MAATVKTAKDTEPIVAQTRATGNRASRTSKQVDQFLASTEKDPSFVKEFFVTILYTVWMTVVLAVYVGLGIYLMVNSGMNEVGARWYFGGGFIVAAIMVLYPITLYQFITKEKRAALRAQADL